MNLSESQKRESGIHKVHKDRRNSLPKGEKKEFNFTGPNVATHREKMIKAAKEAGKRRSALASERAGKPVTVQSHASYWDSGEKRGLSIMITEQATMTFRSNFLLNGKPCSRKLWRVGDKISDRDMRERLQENVGRLERYLAKQEGDPAEVRALDAKKGGRWAERVTAEIEIARKIVQEDRDNARKGIDPRTLKNDEDRKLALKEGRHPDEVRAEEEAAVGGKTLRQVVELYLADATKGGGAKLRSRPEYERKFEKDLKAWHDRPIATITRGEIRALVKEKALKSPVGANRLLSFIKRLWAWAEYEELAKANPARAVEPPAEEKPRDRYLDEDEIRAFWKACQQLPDRAARIFRLLLVTGLRRANVGELQWSEIGEIELQKEPEKVSVPAIFLSPERMKRKKAHFLPLPPLAMRLIGRQGTGNKKKYVFTTERAGEIDSPPSSSSYKNWKKELDEEIGKFRAEEKGEPYDPEKHDLPGWHLHDLRATTTSHMERMGIDRRVISRILHHAEGDKSVTARYARYGFDKEAAEAIKLWSDELERIINPPSNENAVALPRKV